MMDTINSVDPQNFEQFWHGYLLALAFTAQEYKNDPTESDPEPLYSNPGSSIDEIVDLDEFQNKIPQKDLAELKQDCLDFFKDNQHLMENYFSDAGADFHFTRNGHGTGFWDRDYEYANKLTEHAKIYGSAELYVYKDTYEIWH